jgi:hypothetical protein
MVPEIDAEPMLVAVAGPPGNLDVYQNESLLLFSVHVGVLAVKFVSPEKIEGRNGEGGEIGQNDLNTLLAEAPRAAEFVHAVLPDRQGLEDGALTAVIPADKQVEHGEIIVLFLDAFEVAQSELRNHGLIILLFCLVAKAVFDVIGLLSGGPWVSSMRIRKT